MDKETARKIVDFMLSYKGEVLAGNPDKKKTKPKPKDTDKTTDAARKAAGLE